MEEKKIGMVTHFFGNISVAAVKIIDDTLKVEDTVHFKGRATDFTQKVSSMQIEHEKITEAKPGDEIGIQVKEHVKEHDIVYKVSE